MFIRLIWTAAACCSGIYANIYHSYLNVRVRILLLSCMQHYYVLWCPVCYKQMGKECANMAAHCCAANCIKECITLPFIILLSYTYTHSHWHLYYIFLASVSSAQYTLNIIPPRESRHLFAPCGCWCGAAAVAVFICVNYFIAAAQQQCTMGPLVAYWPMIYLTEWTYPFVALSFCSWQSKQSSQFFTTLR